MCVSICMRVLSFLANSTQYKHISSSFSFFPVFSYCQWVQILELRFPIRCQNLSVQLSSRLLTTNGWDTWIRTVAKSAVFKVSFLVWLWLLFLFSFFLSFFVSFSFSFLFFLFSFFFFDFFLFNFSFFSSYFLLQPVRGQLAGYYF